MPVVSRQGHLFGMEWSGSACAAKVGRACRGILYGEALLDDSSQSGAMNTAMARLTSASSASVVRVMGTYMGGLGRQRTGKARLVLRRAAARGFLRGVAGR